MYMTASLAATCSAPALATEDVPALADEVAALADEVVAALAAEVVVAALAAEDVVLGLAAGVDELAAAAAALVVVLRVVEAAAAALDALAETLSEGGYELVAAASVAERRTRQAVTFILACGMRSGYGAQRIGEDCSARWNRTNN